MEEEKLSVEEIIKRTQYVPQITPIKHKENANENVSSEEQVSIVLPSPDLSSLAYISDEAGGITEDITALDAKFETEDHYHISFENLFERIKALGHTAFLAIPKEETVVPKNPDGIAYFVDNRLEVNTNLQQITLDGREPIQLANFDFRIFLFLVANRGRVMSYDEIRQHVWGVTEGVTNSVIRVHIKNIRNALGPDFKWIIKTLKEGGYYFDERVSDKLKKI